MSTLEFREHAGSDGLVHLTVPVEQPECTYRIIVQIEAVPTSPSTDEWPPGFIEATAGKWVGEFPEIADMPFEKRLPL